MKKSILYFTLFCLCTTISFSQLKITFPNANAKLVIASDTLITWEGISETDSVKLEYSTDGGVKWLMLSPKAIDNNYKWKKIPNNTGNGYLLRLIHKGKTINNLDEPYIEWQKTFGGSSFDQLTEIKELKDGGYIAVGNTWSNDGDLDTNRENTDIWVLKLDSKGNKLFSRTYGGDYEETPNFVLETKDHGFLVGGKTSSEDFGNNLTQQGGIFGRTSQVLIKIDSVGNLIWRKNYGNEAGGHFADSKETVDDGFIVIGDTVFHSDCAWDLSAEDHIWILKIDALGNYRWSITDKETYGNIAYSIEYSIDGGYIISYNSHRCGDINTTEGGMCVLKINKFGKKEWQTDFIDDKTSFGRIKQGLNGEYYCLMATLTELDATSSIVDGFVLFKLRNDGTVKWKKDYSCLKYGYLSSMEKSLDFIDDEILFCGSTTSGNNEFDTKSNGWLVNLDTTGNIKFQRVYGGSDSDVFHSAQQTSDSGYIICGTTMSSDGDITENKGSADGWIVKLSTQYQPIDTLVVPFSIVAPQPASRDVDMGKVYVGEWRDSSIADFVYNVGEYKFRVDSIYIRGADKTAFSLIGGFPKYNVEPDSGKPAKFKFTPSRVGMHKAEIVIITQTDTLVQNIIGEGLKKRILISAELKPFNNLICDNSTTTTVEIKSTGGETLIIKELNLTGPDKADFSINEPLPINLLPDSSKNIAIGFKTDVPGIKTAALEIKSNADPDSVITIPLTVRKDSIALVPYPTLIDLGTLFPNQTKDSSFIISNLGTIKTDGKVIFTNNLNCANPIFSVDSGGVYKLDFTFTGLSADGNINEKITVWDEVCKYSREVLINGKVVSPHLLGFSAVQCKSYSNEYKLTLNNNTSNQLKITSIEIENNNQLFIIDPSLVFPIAVEPYSTNNEVRVTYEDNTAQKFTTAVKCFTDNEFIPVLTDTIYAETVDYTRTTSGLINDTIHTASNPFAVSYDSESEFGKNKFTYKIIVNESANDMDYLTELSDLEVIINYNRNVLGADFDTQSGNVKVRLSNEIYSNYTLKSAKETKIDQLNSQIIVNLENTGKTIITKDSYKLFDIDFSAYLSNYNLTDEQNTEKSRKAVISHSITTPDECISYETADNAYLDIEKLCTDDIRSIKLPADTTAKFYLGNVIPHPIGSKGATIEYGLGFECEITLSIYDISGAIILTPINEIQKAGIHKQTISSKSLSAGAYFIEMKAGPFKETKRVIVE
jgi:hypothetical protein